MDNETFKKEYNADIGFVRCSFLGRPMTVSFASLFLFEKLLLEYPFQRIIEFGTWRGTLSLYLLLYSLSENSEFYTYDIKKFSSYEDEDKKDVLKESLDFNRHFRQKDIFNNIEEIKNLIRQTGRSILFCDDGDKKREFNTFVPFLKKGDVVGFHDWTREVQYSDIKETVTNYGLELVFEMECTRDDNLIRFFKKNK